MYIISIFKNANPYPKYFTENKEEAFAEHLGRYIFKRVFGKDYPRYIIDTNSPENIKRIYPEDERYKDAFSPMDKAEYYFADLYNKLFEHLHEFLLLYFISTFPSVGCSNSLLYKSAK